ncbi:MAG: hypothetical protein J3T61_09970 [Candidatus Brocadiales bacterium]|nr:hypothetical protein [Candidatus Bathyanammoxibius sp.]
MSKLEERLDSLDHAIELAKAHYQMIPFTPQKLEELVAKLHEAVGLANEIAHQEDKTRIGQSPLAFMAQKFLEG